MKKQQIKKLVKWLEDELDIVYGSNMFEHTKTKFSQKIDSLITSIIDDCPEPRIDIQKTAGYFSKLMEWKNKWKI